MVKGKILRLVQVIAIIRVVNFNLFYLYFTDICALFETMLVNRVAW